jgi:hypothetical protein
VIANEEFPLYAFFFVEFLFSKEREKCSWRLEEGERGVGRVDEWG